MEIAVNGIDGVGKSTFIEAALSHFENIGVWVSVIDLPYFRRTHGLSRISPYLSACGEWIETRSRLLYATLMVFSAALYWFARWRTRWASVVLVEHHPRIAITPYALLYGGRFGSLLASTIRTLWPKPDYLVLLTVDPYESKKRIICRGRRAQWRQTVELLSQLQQSMMEAAREVPQRFVGEHISPSELLDNLKTKAML